MAAYLPKSCRQVRLPCRLLESLHWLELVVDITLVTNDDFLEDKSCDFGRLETVVLGVKYLATFLVVVLVTFLNGDASVEVEKCNLGRLETVVLVEYLTPFLVVVLNISFFTVVVSGEYENCNFGRFDVLCF